MILDDIELIKEAYNDPVLNGRPDNKIFNLLAGGKHGWVTLKIINNPIIFLALHVVHPKSKS